MVLPHLYEFGRRLQTIWYYYDLEIIGATIALVVLVILSAMGWV